MVTICVPTWLVFAGPVTYHEPIMMQVYHTIKLVLTCSLVLDDYHKIIASVCV